MTNEVFSKKIPVLLLKTKSSPTDAYEDYFLKVQNGRFEPIFVPVLEHRFRGDSLVRIRTLIEDGDFRSSRKRKRTYGALIFTSQRAVEAFASVVKDIRDGEENIDDMLPSDLQLYVVGPATARGLRALDLKCPIIGEESGNGEVLAELILSHYNKLLDQGEMDTTTRPSLLFLVGEKRRDIIPKTLQSQSLPATQRLHVDELEVYETGEMKAFKSNFSDLWSSNNAKSLEIQWVVVFSPTGCKAMLEVIRSQNFSLGSQVSTPTQVATIGPTTKDFLEKELGFKPDVCAEKPSPEGVGEAILSKSGIPGGR